ncbi:MAG: DUF3168 domain-containing protein [Hyphomicrobiaceae bacterium]|nr:DUF3168 domain-containing protein [Hyphomicrobiaceae bacterium]
MPLPDASLSLQAALVTTLTSDPTLLALTGGASRVFDFVPPRTPYPYVTIGQTLERDWATGTEPGSEHVVTLQIWSRTNGRREAAVMAKAIRDALHDAPLTLTGHRLVNLRHEFTETRRDSDGETIRGLVRFRAVTEPL